MLGGLFDHTSFTGRGVDIEKYILVENLKIPSDATEVELEDS